jgi:hypothetical protein
MAVGLCPQEKLLVFLSGAAPEMIYSFLPRRKLSGLLGLGFNPGP